MLLYIKKRETMCQSLKDGGLRCYSHALASFDKAVVALQDHYTETAVANGLMTREKQEAIVQDAIAYGQRRLQWDTDYQSLNHLKAVDQVAYVMGKDRIEYAAISVNVSNVRNAIIKLEPEYDRIMEDYKLAKKTGNAEGIEEARRELREARKRADFDAQRLVAARIAQFNSGARDSLVNSQQATAQFNLELSQVKLLSDAKTKFEKSQKKAHKLEEAIKQKAYMTRSARRLAAEAGYRTTKELLDEDPTEQVKQLKANCSESSNQVRMTNTYLKEKKFAARLTASNGDIKGAYGLAKESLGYRIKQQTTIAKNIKENGGEVAAAKLAMSKAKADAKALKEMDRLYDMGNGGPDAALGLYYNEWDARL